MPCPCIRFFFFFNDTATTEIYTLSLHDALPICTPYGRSPVRTGARRSRSRAAVRGAARFGRSHPAARRDRKSTRLNSSHLVISYAVFCLKKKKHKRYSTLAQIAYRDSQSVSPNL